MQLFYSNNIKKNTIILDQIETKHCTKVLRRSIGDIIEVVDGKGNYFKAKIINFNKIECVAKIVEKKVDFNKRTYYSHIVISPTKNHERLEWFVEKAVEIGIDEISLIKCERTMRKKVRMDRLEKIAKTAMKQTIKSSLPKINSIVNFNDFKIKLNDSNTFICHLNEEIKNTIFNFRESFDINKSTCIFIGPEGDFTVEEVKLALEKGIHQISLGNSRLRTETAGVVACHLINISYLI